MNPIIKTHFHTFETRLIESPVIVSCQILRREISASDGKIRAKASLSDGGNIELFEYVTESKGNIRLLKYSFHWQDKHNKMKRRWDNAPHHLNYLILHIMFTKKMIRYRILCNSLICYSLSWKLKKNFKEELIE